MFFYYFCPNAAATTGASIPIEWSEKPTGNLYRFCIFVIKFKFMSLSLAGYEETQCNRHTFFLKNVLNIF